MNYYGAGCYNCGSTAGAAAVGAAVGVAVGAAAASSSNSANSQAAYQQGYTAGATSANTANANAAAANANAAAANANAAAANANVAARAHRLELRRKYSHGTDCSVLPSGASRPRLRGRNLLLCGNTWFSPSYGANGVHYKVVPTP